MQDISIVPVWDRQHHIEVLKKTPLQQKTMKAKLDKIYQISSYNQLEYVDQVLDVVIWIKLAHEQQDSSRFFANQKAEKWFFQEFVSTAIRYMIICRRFQNLILMVLTQQMMVEALLLFSKRFDLLDKFPKTNSILKIIFEYDKQFYKLNYVNHYNHLSRPPITEESTKNEQFMITIKPEMKVEIIKIDPHTRRFCWLPGTVRKVTSINIHVLPDNDKTIYPFEKKMMLVYPENSHKEKYQWRYNLEKGNKVDFQDSKSIWVSATVTDLKVQELDPEGQYVEIELEWGDQNEWIPLCDTRIQAHGTFSSSPFNIPRGIAQSYLDDFNDVLLDPEMKSVGVVRYDYCKSYLLVDFINYAHKESNLLERIVNAIQTKKFGIQVTAELVSCISQLHPLLHRNFALQYLNRMTVALLEYVTKADELTIRNFTKERFEFVSSALTQFLKRIKPSSQRKAITEELQLGLANRFLQSDFLDRKLYAVTVLTSLIKQSKHKGLKRTFDELIDWVKEKKVLNAIYNEKSHSQLISRSADLLQYYLLSHPTFEELTPLLEWNEAILKLLNDCYEYFPEAFREELVTRIKAKQNVKNKDALDIVKRTPGCEAWLLANGGQIWVTVVKDKHKRKADIVEVFKYPFPVVEKITREVAQLYECKFKIEYFLLLIEANYLPSVLRDDTLPFLERVQFAAITIEHLPHIKDELFEALAPYTQKMDQLPQQAQAFFISILPKLTNKNLVFLFSQNFSDESQLKKIGSGQFELFKSCFLKVNEEERLIDRRFVSIYPTAQSYRKERKQILTIKANPNQLVGMKELMIIIFGSNDLKVTQLGLEFIGFLFDHLSEELKPSVLTFRTTFLETCLTQLYSATSNQEKYLRIIEGLLDESEKGGIDAEPSVSSLFITQTLSIKLIDHFNVNKSRSFLEVSASLTLHELRAQICRHLNAYPHQLKLLMGQKQLDPRLNGRVIHTLGLTNSELIAEKKSTVEKASLTDNDGNLRQKCKQVLRKIFRQFSQLGLMSKPQCQKYHQRCVGEVSSMSESKVDKIYEQYDADKDGYLTEENFLSFYEHSSKRNQGTVWNNLQTFGIRNDLEDLTQLEISYPEPQSLTRHLLFLNKEFMTLLINLLQSQEDKLAQAAWRVANRLPLLPSEVFFSYNLNNSKPLLFRYWLYEVISSSKWQLLQGNILQRILNSQIETTCIGLRAAINSPNFEVDTFHRILIHLKKVNSSANLSFHSQVVLDNTLRILEWLLRQNEGIRDHYAAKSTEYDHILASGLMSKNPVIRKMYCEAIKNIMLESAEANVKIFEPFFRLVYGNFEKCDKATLSLEYFDLYSELLEIIKMHQELLPKLELNWIILTQSMISLFLSHKCCEAGLNSPPDQVAQGYLRILKKMLNKDTLQLMVPLVKFLFQNSLFPESGQNKLKNSKSRKEGYQLLQAICNLRDQNGNSPGLKELFGAGFKGVYKKMSANRSSSYSFSSYFYSYNEARSELGYAGIRNLGCICYMISMLQQLFMTQSFRSLILMADDGQPECLAKKGTKEVDDNIFHQLQSMFANLELTERQDYNPDEFCFAWKDMDGQPVNVSIQQDAQEFLNFFFDRIQSAVKHTPFKYVVEDSYGGKVCNLTVCSNCKVVNERPETFYPLSLEIKGFKNIHESLSKFIQGEVISDYQCDACKQKADVTKSCLIQKVPNFLIIHLQRICFNYEKFQNEKVNSRLEFPQNLNVYNYTTDKQKNQGNAQDYQFKLKGIVLHYGSAQFGHYFSYIKESENKWIQFNDQRVREFDPHDIEFDCYGGEHWRRESQSAYLLVYEKVAKRPLRLEFSSQEEQSKVLKNFGLSDSLYQTPQKMQEEESGYKNQMSEEIQQKEKGMQIQMETQKMDVEKEGEGVEKKEEKKILVELDSQNIPTYVPEELRNKISKANEDFSFTLNLSNDQFAHFLHKVLTIDPPSNLSTEFLELCYECFNLRTIVDEGQGVTLSEWAAKRFKDLIGGHGWQFLKSFGQNWQSDILSIQKSTRVGIKNLLQCVIIDIIRTAESEQDASDKNKLVKNFLERYTSMLSSEVGKNWTRFKEYFEVWIALITESPIIKRWCSDIQMVQRLLDFIMEEYSPFSKSNKRYSLRNMHYGAEFQYPLEVLTLLIKEDYELSAAEKQCMRHYAFMEKVIKYPTDLNMVEYLCKDDRALSEKFAYLILTETGKVTQSDEIKPIIATIRRFLSIKDAYQQLRLSCLIGFPQYIQSPRTNSYGIFGIYPDQDMIVNFVSPIRAIPLTQQLIKFKSKMQHVGALLFSFLLQMEEDGFIHNLDSYPGVLGLASNYTYWGQVFVDTYYQDTHRSYIAKYYTEYGDKLKTLWENRPNRLFPTHPIYLIGRSLNREVVKEVKVSEIIEVEYIDVTSRLLLVTAENSFLNKRNIKNFAGSEDFKVKLNSPYGGSSYLNINIDRSNVSSDDEEPLDKHSSNPFDKAFEGVLFKKISIKNLSGDNVLMVATIKTPNPSPNFAPANFETSFEVKGQSIFVLTLKKNDVQEPFGEFSLQLKMLGMATKEGYWPRQLITDAPLTLEEEQENSDNEQESSSNTWTI